MCIKIIVRFLCTVSSLLQTKSLQKDLLLQEKGERNLEFPMFPIDIFALKMPSTCLEYMQNHEYVA